MPWSSSTERCSIFPSPIKSPPYAPQQPNAPPTVLSRGEVHALLQNLEGVHRLMAELLYGAGLRLMECVRLRVKDVDFSQKHIAVRSGKGNKDRVTLLPTPLAPKLRAQFDRVRERHAMDIEAGYGSVYLPHALARKYPNAAKEWVWQYVFPARTISRDPRSGISRRHHVQRNGIQKAVHRAAKQARIEKRVGCHTLRHSFATHLLEDGVNIRVLQELMGHADVKTTEIYTHVMDRSLSGIRSPLDNLTDS